ncbi:MAG: hypothetical protein P4L83_03795, partial [Nevskia sp.]|nr:hypothetical protein [Nevskia sp.]
MNDAAQEHPSPVDAYLARLPLSAEARARLRQQAAGDLERLHRVLAADAASPDAAAPADNPAYASIPARLKLAFAPPHRRGDDRADTVCTTDRRGEPRLVSTPPLKRASMVPRPWETNPLRRLLRGLRRRLLG